MATIKTKGIIIAENNVGDFDKMLTMLTPGMRKNFVYCKRSTSSQKCSFSGYTIFLLRRIYDV